MELFDPLLTCPRDARRRCSSAFIPKVGRQLPWVHMGSPEISAGRSWVVQASGKLDHNRSGFSADRPISASDLRSNLNLRRNSTIVHDTFVL